jgi:hypothetical protein
MLPRVQAVLIHLDSDTPDPDKPNTDQALGKGFTDSVAIVHCFLPRRLALLLGLRWLALL